MTDSSDILLQKINTTLSLAARSSRNGLYFAAEIFWHTGPL